MGKKSTDQAFILAKKLTTLQRKIVLNIVSIGMSHRQAYIKAGGRAKSKESQDSAVHTMLSKVEVKAFHNYLIKETISKTKATREEALNELADIMRAKTEKATNKVSAIRQISKMEGWDAPAQVQHSGGLEIKTVINEIIE